jgi:hypothetical protein
MNKSLIILISLIFIGFSFFATGPVSSGSVELEFSIKNLRQDLAKQEDFIRALRKRYNSILKRKKELLEFIEQEQKIIKQIEDARREQSKIAERPVRKEKDLSAKEEARKQAESAKKERERRLSEERQKELEKLTGPEKEKLLRSQEEETKQKLVQAEVARRKKELRQKEIDRKKEEQARKDKEQEEYKKQQAEIALRKE